MIASLENGRGRVERAEGVIVVGRDARSTVVLDERGVSGSHCRFSPMPELPGAYLLEDLASTYGTFVNSVRVGRPVVVSGRDVVSVGGSMLMLAPPGQEQAAIARLSAMASPQAEAAAPAPVAPGATPQLGAFSAGAPWMQQFEHFDELARGWQDSGRPKGKLLRGPIVRIAEQWLAAGINQSPTPGALHRDFVEQSRNGRLFRLQMLVLFVVLGVIVAGGGLAAFVFRADLLELWNGRTVESDPDPPPELLGRPEVKPVELAALIQAVQAEAASTRRLLLESAVAEVARSQGRPLLSDAVWDLHQSAQNTLAQERETVLRGHIAPVTDVEFSPDGVRVASASEDGTARIWDFSAPSPGRVSTLRGHIGAVNVLAFSPDGTRLVTGGDGGKVWLWDATVAEPAASGILLRAHEARVVSLAWHPDGKRLASGDETGVLVLWDADAPRSPLSTRTAHDDAITSLLFDGSDPPSLWSGSEDRVVRQWALREDGSIARSRTLDEHLGGVTALAVSDDRRWAATATSSGEVLLWPLATRRKRGKKKKRVGFPPPLPLLGHEGMVASLAFTPDGHWLITAGGSGLRMWDLRAKDPGIASVVLPGHSGDVTQMVLAAGNRAVTGATDDTLRVWDLEKSQTAISSAVLDGHVASVRAVAVSKDGLRVASGAEDHTVRVWDAFGASAGRGGAILRVGPTAVQDFGVSNSDRVLGLSTADVKVWTLSDRGRWRMPVILEGASGLLKAGAIDSGGRSVAAGTETGPIYVWSLSDPGRDPTVLEGHAGPVNGLSYLPDGRLVSISSDRSVRVWNVGAPQAVSTWTGHSDEVVALAVSPTGDTVFTGGLDGMLLRWNVADGTSIQMPGHEGEILQIRVSPDGTRVASGSADRKAHVWDAATGKLLHEMRGHKEKVFSVAFGRSKKLATGGADGRVLVWDLTSDQPHESPQALLGHEQSVTALVFSRDLEVLASGSNDKTLRLWRLDSGRELQLPGHDRIVAGLKLTQDGSHLISGGFDGTLRVWPLAHTSFIRTICDVVGQSLPEGEAAAALGVPVQDPCL
ncbi:MAG: FHA domain-containing protein [Nannocystaceae bacterium]|nr:FHA domain-containing protein [Nannocystaceae bacterium]